MAVSNIEGGRAGEGYLAGVDSRNRLMTVADLACTGSDVTTTITDVGTGSTATLVSANDDRMRLLLQNKGSTAVQLVFGTGDPGADDFELAPGETFLVPFCWKGPVKAKRVSGTGKVVALETEESAS